MRSILAATFLSLLFGSQALAYDLNGWQISRFPDNASATGCLMGGNYRDGTRLSIIVFKDYSWALALANKTWTLRKDGSTDVAAFVDNRLIASGKASHTSTTVAILPLKGASPYRALQAGRRLDIQTPYGKLNFALTGTSRAMDAVLACVKALQPTPPPPPPVAASDFQLVPAAEATALVANLLTTAGITGYRLDPPKQSDSRIFFTLADGTVGYFLAARGSNTKNADEYAGVVISNRSNACKGEFLSGKQAVPSVDGSVVRKIVTTCRVGADAVITETTVIRRPNGFLVELSQAGGTPTALNAGEKGGDRAAVVNAAMTSASLR
jgi:hypothetical protein